jgi:hypothetical protein
MLSHYVKAISMATGTARGNRLVAPGRRYRPGSPVPAPPVALNRTRAAAKAAIYKFQQVLE